MGTDVSCHPITADEITTLYFDAFASLSGSSCAGTDNAPALSVYIPIMMITY